MKNKLAKLKKCVSWVSLGLATNVGTEPPDEYSRQIKAFWEDIFYDFFDLSHLVLQSDHSRGAEDSDLGVNPAGEHISLEYD